MKSGTRITSRRVRTCACWPGWMKTPTRPVHPQRWATTPWSGQTNTTRPEISIFSWGTAPSIFRIPLLQLFFTIQFYGRRTNEKTFSNTSALFDGSLLSYYGVCSAATLQGSRLLFNERGTGPCPVCRRRPEILFRGGTKKQFHV